MTMKWRLNELMAECTQQTGDRMTYTEVSNGSGVGRTILYRLAGQEVTRTDLENMSNLLTYFSDRLGRTVQTNELLEFVPDSE